ncbi:hypothetical protein SAY86_023228 [Trapa natans]|uniref:Protein kinase domain-containing protein n=1 Tax=Trapa natans TaxID=22666 RepID=A0AAN7LPN8_TRANT|nr:hypothetical protein SAY86_023228 [Trapa natans]
MGGGGRCPNLVFLLISMILLLGTPALHGQELELLLSFKSSVHDPQGFLSSWSNGSSSNFCSWQGITCDSSSHVTAIQIPGKDISGKLPPTIFQLGSIETVDLSSNQFSGEIPGNMFSRSSLKSLNLSGNNLTGPIPRGSISSLEVLDLSNNILSGEIPQDIGSFTSLRVLDLGGNVLTGEIPNSIPSIQSLEFLTLASNQLAGGIPRSFGQMKRLKWIYLGYNNLSGEIPDELGEITHLTHLDLVYNNLTGPIPPTLGNLSNLQYLFLYQNRLTGSIPSSIFGLEKLLSLDLSDNFLSGEVPELIVRLQRLEILHLFGNSFNGNIPISLASMPRLHVLQLWSNNLSGPIPDDLGKRSNLTIIDLSTNSLTGRIPQHLCDSGNLVKLILFSNSLDGEIPESLTSCKSLQRVRLQNNRLSGGLSPEFTRLPLVYYLDLSGNILSGSVGEQLWNMPSLQMLNLARNRFSGTLPDCLGNGRIESLDLSENRFSGNVSVGFGDLCGLMQMKLSGNDLSGGIPEEIARCTKLVSLDLSRNRITGPIPISLSKMPVLGELDLSENELIGTIPSNLGQMEPLIKVNVSYNHLHGKLPSTGAFIAINASAVSGNNLCGGVKSTGLPPCRGGAARRSIRWSLFICLLVTAIMICLAYAFVLIRQRRGPTLQKTIDTEDGVWEVLYFDPEASKMLPLNDVMSAVMEQNVISRGKNGTSYKGRSSTEAVDFLVKELDGVPLDATNHGVEAFELGKLRHRNIVKLLAIFSSQKKVYLVYEYVKGKKLREVVHGLSWDKRLKIAVGIARALKFLHFSCRVNARIGDISPEKIIVDSLDEARLRLSHPQPTDKRFISSSYRGPDEPDGKEKSHIYSFGLILIKLLTGKSPTDGESFGVHGNIVHWGRYCYSDCHMDSWVDPILKGTVSNSPNEMAEAMNLALHCTAADPTARPSADRVVKALESLLRTDSFVSGPRLPWCSV